MKKRSKSKSKAFLSTAGQSGKETLHMMTEGTTALGDDEAEINGYIYTARGMAGGNPHSNQNDLRSPAGGWGGGGGEAANSSTMTCYYGRKRASSNKSIMPGTGPQERKTGERSPQRT